MYTISYNVLKFKTFFQIPWSPQNAVEMTQLI